LLGRQRLDNVLMGVNRLSRCLRRLWEPAATPIWHLTFVLLLSMGMTHLGKEVAAGDVDPVPALRIGTSGDYAPFSFAAGTDNPEWTPEGFDIDVARAYAQERGLKIEWIRFRWPDLIHDLEANRFDIAMSGITVRPERSLAGRYSVPIANSGAVALLPKASPLQTLDALNHSDIRIAVNHGGHLERVTRARFPQAQILAIDDNRAVLNTLAGDRADAVITDTLEAPGWRELAPGTTQLGPFTRDTKAYLLEKNQNKLAADLNGWLLDREADQTLDSLRRQGLGQSMSPPPASALQALLAAIDERLALMPEVAESKRGSGRPVEDRSREEIVIERAVTAADNASLPTDSRAFDETALRALFRAQIEAAKDIQNATLAAPTRGAADAPAKLHEVLRPALGRIGDRISWLLVRLPSDLDRDSVHEQTRLALKGHALAGSRVSEIAEAILGIHAATAQPPTGPPGLINKTRNVSGGAGEP
jgi:cyclohexadienyl dehydratase